MVNHQFDVILDGPTWVMQETGQGAVACALQQQRPQASFRLMSVILTAELSRTLGRLLGKVAACQLERICSCPTSRQGSG